VNSVGWPAAMAMMHRFLPPSLHADHSADNQSALGSWPLAGHARLEVVEERGENGNGSGDTLRQSVKSPQPEHSTSIPVSKPTSHAPSDLGERYDDVTEAESGGSTKRLDTVRPDGSEGHTTIRTILKEKSKSVIPTVPDSPPSGLLSRAIILAVY